VTVRQVRPYWTAGQPGRFEPSNPFDACLPS